MINGIEVNPMTPTPKKVYVFDPKADIHAFELAAIIGVLGVLGVNEEGYHVLNNTTIGMIDPDGNETVSTLSRHYALKEPESPIVVPGK